MHSMPSIGGGGTGGHGGLVGDLALPPTEDLARTGLTPGQRSKDMYRLALRLWRKLGQGGEAAVLVECGAVWDATPDGDDPFPWHEALGCIRSARRFAAQQDRLDRLAAEQFRAWMHSGGRPA
jgi:hypothetical protein